MKTQTNIKLRVLFSCWLFLLATKTAFAQQLNWYNNGLIHINTSAKIVSIGDFENKEEGSFINNGEAIFKSDIINHGDLFFSETLMSHTRIEGNNSQRVSGTHPIKFYNLELNTFGTSEIDLENDLEIYGHTIFNHGILNTRETGGAINFYPQATVSNASNYSFIDGFTRKYGKESFQFPIGNKGWYRAMRIYGNTNALDAYEAIYHYENSDRYFPHTSKQHGISYINTEEYWELIDYHTTDHVYVSIRLSNETMPNVLFNTNATLTIVAWDLAQQKWVDLGGVLDEVEEWITTIFKVDIYGVYTIALKEGDTDDLEIFNAVNPKDNYGNEYFRIEGIHAYPENELRIFNKWGELVYQTKAYNTEGNVFKGIAKGGFVLKEGSELPEGTYFYILKRGNPKGGKHFTNVGYLYLIR